MRFTPDLLDEIRARLPVSQIVMRRVKLKRQGREFIGLSPFKTEKTPSFTVNDQKGFYHCFASGEHGDIFTFMMKTEGLAFPEAVELLAQEAGVPLPKASPQDMQHEQKRARLYEVMETAADYFERQLKARHGANARDYLTGREVSDEQRAAFRLGYALDSRSALKTELAQAGYTHDEMVQSGLLIAGEDIPVSYDRFRHRIIFPITDLKNRVIAFGGRALDADQPAKYLNSPETPLFHKGAILFNAAVARQAAFETGNIIVAEGYMDVIALAGAGIANVVAPLGTALTENQLRLIWRMASEPILCFDGDEAGRKAAYRAIDLAFPLLQPGKSLRFVFLPDGEDPDDVIRDAGAAAMRRLLDKAKPLADVVWLREKNSSDSSTPERRAALQSRLMHLASQISDPTVREHYTADLKSRLREAFGQGSGSYGGWGYNRQGPQKPSVVMNGGLGATRGNRENWRGKRWQGANEPWQFQSASSELMQNKLVGDELGQMSERESLLLQTLFNHSWLLEDYLEEVAGLRLESNAAKMLRDALLELHAEQNPLDTRELRTQLKEKGLGRELARQEQAITHKSVRYAEPGALEDDVKTGWRSLLALQSRFVALKKEFEAAIFAFHRDQSEENLSYINQLHSEINALGGVGRTSESPVSSDKKFEETIQAAQQTIAGGMRGQRK